jgi:hypothetical protein
MSREVEHFDLDLEEKTANQYHPQWGEVIELDRV